MLALLCGGQGTLSDKVFDLVAHQAAAEPVFAAATACLGEDPRKLVRTQGSDELSANHVSQILTVTSALAIHGCIADLLTGQTAVTGYSVGEMAAWSIAGIWTAEEALRLTDVRAQLMDRVAGPGGRLGYVRGLDQAALEPLLEAYRCKIAIRNPDRLVVIGGSEQDVIDLCQEAVRRGAVRSGLLAVKIASHTSRLARACKPLQEALDASRYAPIASGRILLAGGDGERILSASDATVKLACQVAQFIDWEATLEALAELGTTRVLDLGPGHALAEMMQAFRPELRCYAADGFRTIEGLRHWVASE
ncbi:malonyl CoA-ACP transacylase [Bradyrhizobium canariense]|uniref:Malonyl CoA-ACP transacylase n=1 Tax=Bradyrhizobium canariense TaxID=255045 RepID=A0ABX3WT55_9BRAD|nr:acyltransferase domain-containing protein [Bradyrhizobium canariense]OSJ07814.1 malonyl CoA-ACP transacylase [Bradyrhizobium canariense]OSJ20661.1 malonyl CoA-ACP transacylase [Bradyrhizobium canariense]